MMNPASTAPAHDAAIRDSVEDKWWEKPCGPGDSPVSEPDTSSEPSPSMQHHLSDLLHQANINLKQIDRLKDIFPYYSLGNGYDYNSVQGSYSWLENRARTKHLEGVHQNEEILKELYRSLQVLGVAFQHIIEEGGARSQLFRNEMKGYLMQILCEIKEIFGEHKIQPYPVDESVVPNKYKKMPDEAQRVVRDFIIFNAYRNHLEWTIEFLKGKGFKIEGQKE